MRKSRLYPIIAVLAIILLGVACTSKPKAPKPLAVATAHVVADTVVHFNKEAACTVHIDFAYLKGAQYATANDSLLRMGTLQPNYVAASYEPLTPEVVVRETMRRYVAEYMEIARWLKDREKQYSELNWALNITTKILPSKGKNILYCSEIAIATGKVSNHTKLFFNIDPKTGKRITLKDEYGNDYQTTLTKQIVEQLADRLDLDEDDTKALQQKGYFVNIAPYATQNFILTDDSTTFVYQAGEISEKEVRISIEN